MMFPFVTRTAIELALIAAGVNEPQQRQQEFAGPAGFDLTSMPYKQSKVYPQSRDPATLDLVVVHVTDVRGGFGVSKRRVKHWTDVLNRSEATIDDEPPGGLPPDVWEQLIMATDPDDPSDETIARRLALWERYRNTPYHRIGAANGDNLRNHPLSFRTKHGGAGNDGAGWALDVGHNQELDDWHIETGRASLSSLLLEMHEANGGRVRVAPHRAFSAGRRNDTNRWVWLGVVKPTVQRFDFAEIDYELCVGSGRPVSRVWDPDALYDHKGRRIAA